MGIACSILIFLWVIDERNVDSFHANGKFLFQVYERNFYDGKINAGYTTQGLLANELKRVIPEVQFSSGYEHASAPGTQTTFEAAGKVIKMDGAFVHLYGKKMTKPGRKMGHVTVLSAEKADLIHKANKIRQSLNIIARPS